MKNYVKLDKMGLPGFGIFETMRSYKGQIFKIKEHLDRLYESAKTSGLKIHLSKDKLKKKILEEFRQSGLKDAYIRVSLCVSPGAGRGAASGCPGLGGQSLINNTRVPADISAPVVGQMAQIGPPRVQIIVKPLSGYPPQYYQQGVPVETVAVRKNCPSAVEPRIKSGDFLWGVMAKIEGSEREAFEVLCLNHEGYVAEGSVSNIFLIKAGRLMTPALSSGILEGITAGTVMALAGKMKIGLLRQPITRHQLYNADEVFLTNTTMEIMPVASLDSRSIGRACPGQLTRRLQTAYRKLTRG